MACPAGYSTTGSCYGTETCVQGSNCQSGRARWKSMATACTHPETKDSVCWDWTNSQIGCC